MAKWFASVKAAIHRLSSFNNSLNKYRKTQRARKQRAHDMLKSVSSTARTRFSDEVLINLLDAGWHEGRIWDHERLSEFQRRFSSNPSSTALAVLIEFGGLEIGLSGRTIRIGEIDDQLCIHRQKLTSLVGPTLYPIGETIIFNDDGLAVHIDEEGRVFIHGPTDPPHDYRIELIASGFDSFLHRAFGQGPTPSLASWDYTASDAHGKQS